MLLLNLAGIENAKVIYFAEDTENATEGHAWNLVKINGNYYHVDTTNDSTTEDADMSFGYVSYAYFLISTEDILKTSPITAAISDYIPACDATEDKLFSEKQSVFHRL
jgi:transglutaminase/protease-like cytokinesis protein 3